MLTIGETFKYYGSLYKMNKSDISSKSKELISWLKLPQSYTLLKDLRLKIYIEIRIQLCFLILFDNFLNIFYKNYLWVVIVEVSVEEFHWLSHYFMIQQS